MPKRPSHRVRVILVTLAFCILAPTASANDDLRRSIVTRLCTDVSVPFLEDRFANEKLREYQPDVLHWCSQGMAEKPLGEFSDSVDSKRSMRALIDALDLKDLQEMLPDLPDEQPLDPLQTARPPAASGRYVGPIARSLFHVEYGAKPGTHEDSLEPIRYAPTHPDYINDVPYYPAFNYVPESANAKYALLHNAMWDQHFLVALEVGNRVFLAWIHWSLFPE